MVAVHGSQNKSSKRTFGFCKFMVIHCSLEWEVDLLLLVMLINSNSDNILINGVAMRNNIGHNSFYAATQISFLSLSPIKKYTLILYCACLLAF